MRKLTYARHLLKVNQSYWAGLVSGEKKFEVRRDDRGFQKGDILRLCHWMDNVTPACYHTREGGRSGLAENAEFMDFRITYILTGGQFGIEPGYVVMAIEPVDG